MHRNFLGWGDVSARARPSRTHMTCAREPRTISACFSTFRRQFSANGRHDTAIAGLFCLRIAADHRRAAGCGQRLLREHGDRAVHTPDKTAPLLTVPHGLLSIQHVCTTCAVPALPEIYVWDSVCDCGENTLCDPVHASVHVGDNTSRTSVSNSPHDCRDAAVYLPCNHLQKKQKEPSPTWKSNPYGQWLRLNGSGSRLSIFSSCILF